MTNEINLGEFGEKAASYPLRGGGIYLGTVLSVVNNLVQLEVRDLGCVFKEVEFIGRTATYILNAGDRVLCAFLGHQTKDIYILGSISAKTDVFASVVALEALEARVETLENQ